MRTRKSSFIFFLIFLVITVSCSNPPEEKFSFSPGTPIPGETIKVVYNPTGTELENAFHVDMVAYIYSYDKPRPKEFPMIKKGKTWQVELPTENENRLAILKFESGDKVDSNIRRGYVISFFDKTGTVVPGGKASLAYALAYSMYNDFLDRDAEKALSLIEEEFTINPQMKRVYPFISLYGSLIFQLKPTEKNLLIFQAAEELENHDDLTIKELVLLEFWYRRINQPEKAEEYNTIIRNSEPNGDYVQGKSFSEYLRGEDSEIKVVLEEQFREEFPDSKYLGYFSTIRLEQFLTEKNFDGAIKYLEKYPKGLTNQHYYMVAQDLIKNDVSLEQAEALALKAVNLAEAEISAPKDEYEIHLTVKQLNNRRTTSLGKAQDALGISLFKQGKNEDALSNLKKAASNTKRKDTEINEHYSEALASAGEPDIALKEISDFLKTEFSTETMKDHLKQAFLRKNGNEEGFVSFLKNLNEEFSDSLMSTLQKSMIDEPASDFTLFDLDGNRVALSELKDKVVVIDFWATWCTYCIQSFPGMEKTMQHFAGQDVFDSCSSIPGNTRIKTKENKWSGIL
ncbi:MAG: redoxin domain-containing protein [Pseudomonadota bacterium]